jgi:hypothetical protein
MSGGEGALEDSFLRSLAPFEPDEIELKANNCTEVKSFNGDIILQTYGIWFGLLVCVRQTDLCLPCNLWIHS